MRKTNRFVALLMALILVFSSAMSTAVFANEDVAGTEFEVTVGKLKAVGIMEGYPDGTFKPEGEITRAEFAKIAIVALGLGDAAEVSRGVTRFPDVPSTHWATGYINLAVNRGILIGYPDGSFQPNGKLTNAEAATILVRLVGLGPVVDKQGTWPANYIGRAANEGILKGVNVASSVNALRGLTAKMLLNTLEVPLWGASGYDNDGSVNYGKLVPQTTLLENMLNIDVVEGRVLAIPRVDSSLEDDEITINDINEDGDDVTLVNATDHSADHLFGLKVNAWVNDDDEIIYAEVKTSASDIIFDEVVAADETDKEIELLVKDKTYDVVTAYDLFLNYDDTQDLDDVDTAADDITGNTVYGKVVLEKGKVVFAHLFSFDVVDAGLVTDVDDTVLTYLDVASEEEIDLDDYKDDEVVVMTAGFMAADVDDIKEDTVMYAFEDGDDLIVVIAGEVVEGKLDRVRIDDARVAGKDYNVTDYTTTSKDSNDNIAAYLYNNASTLDLVGEEVEVVLDINGDLRHIVGDAESTSGTLYGLAVNAYAFGPKNVVEIFNAEGKKVAYDFETKADGTGIIAHFGISDLYVGVSYELNKDGEIKDATFDDTLVVDYAAADVEFHKNRNRIEVDDDNDPLTAAVIYYYNSDTVFMKSDGDEKEAVVSWSNLVGTSAQIDVVIVGDPGKTADFVWIYDDYATLADDDFFGVVTANAYYNGDDWITTVNVAGLGIKEYVYADETLKKGDIVSFKVSSSNELLADTIDDINGGYTTTITVTGVDGDFITIAGPVTYKLDSDVVVYATKAGENVLDKAVSKSQIKAGDDLAVVIEEGIIKVAVRVLP